MVTDAQVSGQTGHWTKSFDSALLILLLTASSYAIAFQYEAGYLSHFGVPTEYVEVNAGRLIVAAGVSFFSVVTALMIWSSFRLVLPRVTRMQIAVTNRLAYLVTWVLISLLLANELAGSWFSRALLCGFPLMLLVGELVGPLFTHRKLPTYRRRLETSILQDIGVDRGTDPSAEVKSVFVRVASPVGAAFLFVVLLLSTFAQAAGVHVARLQSDFLVANVEQPCVVVRSLSEGLLCVSFDPKTRAPRGEYRFLKPEGSVLRLTSLGPLAKVEPQRATH